MDKIMLDPNVQVAGWMKESPTTEWVIRAPNGITLFRCSSSAPAEEAFRALLPLLKEDIANEIRIEQVKRWPEYLGNHSDACDYARYCEWALRQLGHVSIFAFNHEESDALFMVVDREGRRIERPTLASALYATMLRHERVTRIPDIMAG